MKDTLLSSLVIVASALMLLKSYKDDSNIGLYIFSLLLLGGIFLLFKALINKITVVVNKKGINNNTNGMGLIPWEFIEGFEISTLGSIEVLVIKINDHENLLAMKNSVTRKIMHSNINKLGSPVVIMENEFDNELTTVKTQLEKYKECL